MGTLRFFVLLLSVLFLNLFLPGNARSFSSAEGGFTVWMPGRPTLERIDHKSLVGNVKENTFTLKTKTEEFDVSFTELPGVATTFESNKALLTKAKDGFLKDSGAKELGFDKIPFEGKEGRELSFQIASTDTQGKARFFLIDNILYAVVGSTTNGQKGMALIDRFLNSFKLLPH